MKKKLVTTTLFLIAIFFSQAQTVLDEFDVLVENGEITQVLNIPDVNLIIPELLYGEPITSIGENAFSSMSLVSVTLPNTVTIIKQGAFSNNQLYSVTLSTSLETIEASAFENNGLSFIELPNTLKRIEINAFRYNSLTLIVFPAVLYHIGANAFADNSLPGFQLPNPSEEGSWNNGRSDEFVFDFTLDYTYTVVSNDPYVLTDTDLEIVDGIIISITTPKEALSKNLIIPNTLQNQTVIGIGEKVFLFHELESITLPNTLEFIGFQSFYKANLPEITLPESLDSIARGAFSFNQLTAISFPENIQHLGYSSFSSNLIEQFQIPAHITTIPEHIFNSNEFSSLSIPSNVMIIEHDAFTDNNIVNLTIPNGVTHIKYDAFFNNQITDISLPNSVIHIGSDAFKGNPDILFNLPSPELEGLWLARTQQVFLVGGTEVMSENTQQYDYFVSPLYSITYYNVENSDDYQSNYIKYPISVELSTPSKLNATFDGWFTNAEFTEQMESIEANSSGDLELYAKFTNQTVTSLNSNTKNQLNLYPNPCSNIINVTSNKNEHITIYSLDGTIKLTYVQSKVDVSNLEPGIYLIKQGEKMAKFVKQ